MIKKIYRKPHRYKRKKSILKNRFFWLGILGILILSSLSYFLFFSQTFQVEKIIVTGEKKISAEEIKSFVPQKNIFLINTKEIKEALLSRFPQIAEATVTRGFFDAINVLVVERAGIATWCQDEKCFLLDNEGIIFEAVSSTNELLRVENAEFNNELILGKAVIEKEKLAQILEIKSKLAEIPKISIVQAVLVSPERLNVKTSEGWEIYFNLKGDLDWQIEELNVVLEKQIPPECISARQKGELEYVDLRFSRVYCK